MTPFIEKSDWENKIFYQKEKNSIFLRRIILQMHLISYILVETKRRKKASLYLKIHFNIQYNFILLIISDDEKYHYAHGRRVANVINRSKNIKIKCCEFCIKILCGECCEIAKKLWFW